MVELFYSNLAQKPANELHKNFIKYSSTIVKSKISQNHIHLM